MSAVPKHTMTVEEFLAWERDQPREAGRFELIDGVVVAQQSERVRHVMAKQGLFTALRDSIRAAASPCTALVDGVLVRTGSGKVYRPDGLVTCSPLDPGAIEVETPVILFEVLSDDSVDREHGEKVLGYFSIPSVVHYLIVDPVRRMIIHHRRGTTDDLLTRVTTSGLIYLDPPGLAFDIADVFRI